MQERRALKTDLDECGLHARQHSLHLTLENIADDATATRALYEQLGEHTTLDVLSPDWDFWAWAPRDLEEIRAEMGVEARFDHRPPRVGDVRDSSADAGTFASLFPEVESVALGEGLRRTVAWLELSRPT